MPMVRAHAFFSGTVQGVGFRFTTQRFALELRLTGWVKNLSDGRVEAVIEGPRPDIEALFTQLKTHFGSYLHSNTVEWLEPQKEFKDFRITY
jgi:acylphosphatase